MQKPIGVGIEPESSMLVATGHHSMLGGLYADHDVVVVTGPRGAGKSTLLASFSNSQGLKSIRINGPEGADCGAFSGDQAHCNFEEAIQSLLDEFAFTCQAGTRGSLASDEALAELLAGICRQQVERTVIIIDEVDNLETHLVPRLETWCKKMNRRIQPLAKPPLWVLIVGWAWGSQAYRSERSAMVQLKPQSFNALPELLTRFGEETNISFTEEAVTRLQWLTGGYPLLIEALLDKCFKERETQGGGESITAGELDQMATNFRSGWWNRAEHAFLQSGPAVQRVLWTVAYVQNEMRQGHWEGGSIQSYLKWLWPSWNLDNVLAVLLEGGVLVGGPCVPQLCAPLLERWLILIDKQDLAELQVPPTRQAYRDRVQSAQCARREDRRGQIHHLAMAIRDDEADRNLDWEVRYMLLRDLLGFSPQDREPHLCKLDHTHRWLRTSPVVRESSKRWGLIKDLTKKLTEAGLVPAGWADI
jgi:hypothetical protein